MNNLKKIGLSALAGSLASLSAAQAGEMAVSGSAELSYVSRDAGELTGNPLGMNKNISFAGSGELDNGWTVSVLHAMNDAMSGNSSSSVTIGMGSLGSISVDSGTGGFGLTAIDNVVPVAFEEADAGFSTGIIDAGSVVSTKNSLWWKAPAVQGAAFTFGYTPRNSAVHTSDGGTDTAAGLRGWEASVDFSPEMVPGLRVGGGMGELENGSNGLNNGDREERTWFATYVFGPLSVGYQRTDDESDGTGSTDYESDVYGASFNVNDVFSVSYQYGETEYKSAAGTAHKTAEFTGISAAYNIGPMAIKFTDNTGRNINGSTTTVDDDNKELNLSMSF